MGGQARIFATIDAAAAYAATSRGEGRRVVLARGAFDLLHPGHVRYLQAARAEGDVLIVAIDADAVVRDRKGTERPFLPESERAEVLAALACVDGVVVVDAGAHGRLVGSILPDVLVAHAGSAEDAVAGREVVEARGGRVARPTAAAGYSTTEIVGRVRRLPR